MTTLNNGLTTPNTAGKEGRKEAEGCEQYLQQQTRADVGSQKRQRIIYIENSANIYKPFIIQDVGSVQEVIEKVCLLYPEICLDCLGMKISNMRTGCISRQFYSDNLPYDQDTLYITLYLRKHPPFQSSKIE